MLVLSRVGAILSLKVVVHRLLSRTQVNAAIHHEIDENRIVIVRKIVLYIDSCMCVGCFVLL